MFSWTQSQFDSIQSSFVCCFGTLSHAMAKQDVYGEPVSEQVEIMFRKMFLILWATNDWQQNENGSTTGLDNFLTQSQLNDLVNAGKQICGCC